MKAAPGDRFDVAIAGAGFAGLALASLLGDAGLRVAVLERRPELAPEGVGLVLQPNGLAALSQLGALPAILRIGQRVQEVEQCDETGRVRARASYAELDHPHPYIVVVERTGAIRELARRLPETAILRLGCRVTGLLLEGGRARGLRYVDAAGAPQVLAAGCVVGADGVNSAIRGAMGARLRWRTGPDRYLIGLAPSPPDGDAARLVCGRGWCNGVLPFGERTYFFDHISGESQEAVDRGDFEAWRRAYTRRVPDGEGVVAGLGSFEDVGFLSGRTHRAVPRTQPGVALVGDAAAAVHPHNGQGANLALEDALALADALLREGPGTPVALARFATARDAKLRRSVPWSLFIGRTLDGPHAGWRAIRRGGYLVSRVPAVRRATTRQQAGLG